MAFRFNPFTSNLDQVLPVTAQTFGSTPNTDGFAVDSANNLTLEPADATHPGGVSTTTQTFGGNKTFSGTTNFSSLTASTALIADSLKNLSSSVTTSVELSYVSGVTSAIQTQLDSKEILANKGAANGYCPLDASTKIPSIYLPSTVFEYQGAWDPSTNTPTLTDLTGTAGYVYRVSTQFSGTIIGLSDPSMTNFQVGNLIIYSGTAWQQTSAVDGVVSVNGAQGAVTVNAINQLTGDIAAGPATQSQSVSSTIQANVVSNAKLAQMAAGTVKANTTGSTANASDVALGTTTETTSSVLTLTGWTNATIGSPTITVKQSSTSQSGYLSSTDWNTFNNKQSALTIGNLTDAGTDGIVITGGTGAVIGSGTSIAQHVADTTHNGYLSSTDWNTFNAKPIANVGDINPSSFSITNNQASPANITGLAFTTHMAEVTYSVAISATSSLFEAGKLLLCNMGSSWQMVQQDVGNTTGIVFSVTNAGQIQYTSGNYTGFTAGTIYFRAITL